MYSSDRKLFIFVVIATCILMLLGYSWKQRTEVPYITVPLSGLATPFVYGASQAVHAWHTGIQVLDDAWQAHSEIEALREQILAEKVDTANYKELVAQNIRLRQMLQFKTTHPEYELGAAQIITRNFGSGMKTFVIDMGADEGVRVMMPVVAPGGVVGFISDVYDHSSRVQTLLDPRTSIGVIVQRPESRLASIVKGMASSPTNMELVDIPKDGDVLAGDTLVTSGYGGVYPKGILVGHVDTIENDKEGYVNHAVVTPSVNFYTLEEVFVIMRSTTPVPVWTKKDINLVPQTKRDQVEGAKGAISHENR